MLLCNGYILIFLLFYARYNAMSVVHFQNKYACLNWKCIIMIWNITWLFEEYQVEY